MSIQINNIQFEGPFSSTQYLQNKSGVYVILAQNNSSNYEILDVGESSDIKFRVENHDRQYCWVRSANNRPIAYSAYYTTGSSEETRLRFESNIRHQYNPKCGDR
jgi:hypothetical protein